MTLFDEQKQENEYDNLFEEEIVIATPKSLNLKNVEYNKESKYPCISLQEIKNQPFIFLRKSTTMRPVVDKIFRNEKVVPKFYLTQQIPLRFWKWSVRDSAVVLSQKPQQKNTKKESITTHFVHQLNGI